MFLCVCSLLLQDYLFILLCQLKDILLGVLRNRSGKLHQIGLQHTLLVSTVLDLVLSSTLNGAKTRDDFPLRHLAARLL